MTFLRSSLCQTLLLFLHFSQTISLANGSSFLRQNGRQLNEGTTVTTLDDTTTVDANSDSSSNTSQTDPRVFWGVNLFILTLLIAASAWFCCLGGAKRMAAASSSLEASDQRYQQQVQERRQRREEARQMSPEERKKTILQSFQRNQVKMVRVYDVCMMYMRLYDVWSTCVL